MNKLGRTQVTDPTPLEVTSGDGLAEFGIHGYVKEAVTGVKYKDIKAIVWVKRGTLERVLSVHKRYGNYYQVISCQLLPKLAEGIPVAKVTLSKDSNCVIAHYPMRPGSPHHARLYHTFVNPILNIKDGLSIPLYHNTVATGGESEYQKILDLASVSDGFNITAPITPNGSLWRMTISPTETVGVSSFVNDGSIVVALHVTSKYDMYTSILLVVPVTNTPKYTNITVALTNNKSIVSVKLT